MDYNHFSALGNSGIVEFYLYVLEMILNVMWISLVVAVEDMFLHLYVMNISSSKTQIIVQLMVFSLSSASPPNKPQPSKPIIPTSNIILKTPNSKLLFKPHS